MRREMTDAQKEMLSRAGFEYEPSEEGWFKYAGSGTNIRIVASVGFRTRASGETVAVLTIGDRPPTRVALADLEEKLKEIER